MAPDFGQGMNPLNNMPQNTYPFYYVPKYSLIKVKGAAGVNTVQLYVNGVAQPQAISSVTTAADTVDTFGFKTFVQVANNNCPCNCVTSPTILQVLNGAQALTEGHINIVVTKIH